MILQSKFCRLITVLFITILTWDSFTVSLNPFVKKEKNHWMPLKSCKNFHIHYEGTSDKFQIDPNVLKSKCLWTRGRITRVFRRLYDLPCLFNNCNTTWATSFECRYPDTVINTMFRSDKKKSQTIYKTKQKQSFFLSHWLVNWAPTVKHFSTFAHASYRNWLATGPRAFWDNSVRSFVYLKFNFLTQTVNYHNFYSSISNHYSNIFELNVA